MLTEFAAAITSLKGLGDLAKTVKDLSARTALEAQIGELLGKITAAHERTLAAQERETALTERVRALEREKLELEARLRRKESYQRTDMGGGTFAYVSKEGVKEGEAGHTICGHCFENGEHVSTLQRRGKLANGQTLMHCPRCEQDFRFGEPQPPQQPGRSGFSFTQARRGPGYGRR